MEKIENGAQVYIHNGYYAGHYGTVEAFYYERNGYSVNVHNERVAFIKAEDCVVRNWTPLS